MKKADENWLKLALQVRGSVIKARLKVEMTLETGIDVVLFPQVAGAA